VWTWLLLWLDGNDGGVVVEVADVEVRGCLWVWRAGGRRRFIGILMDVQPSPQKELDGN
jgi:hypothetical protein